MASPAPQSRAQRDLLAEARWRTALREAYTDLSQLEAAGLLRAGEAAALAGVSKRYRLRLPRYYAGLIDRLRPETCPIRAQALPHLAEREPEWPAWAVAWSRRAFGTDMPWRADAIGDVAQLAAPRLTHRYVGRALVHVTTACALYCRFCFRKAHLNAEETALYGGPLTDALAYIAQDRRIREVILTGGDPLSMTDAWLQRFFDKIQAAPHVHTVRLHSRMLVTLPCRITHHLAALLRASRLHIVVVSHFNHPRELTREACLAIRRLRRAGVTQLNQSVLLAGVNDRLSTLARLFEGLYAQGLVPYYLHHADWTPDTFHFRVPIARGQRLVRALRGRLPGPSVPRYMVDVPGGLGKVDLLDGRVERLAARCEGPLSGALWRLPLPQTRQPPASTCFYADFWPNTR